jgi:four helix bundle protein
MATINHFQDLDIWKEARELSKIIYDLSNRTPFSKDFSLKDQIRRFSGSVMDNIAEGFERSGTNEFIQFLSIAKGSVAEVHSQLYRALDQVYITQQEFDSISERIQKIGGGIMKLIIYLRNCEIKGIKFKKH